MFCLLLGRDFGALAAQDSFDVGRAMARDVMAPGHPLLPG
jgi:hypothetical protein